MTTDVCVPISRLAECIGETVNDVAKSFIPATILGHVGDGNFHCAMLVMPDDSREYDEAERLNQRIVARALAVDGTCTGEHGVGLHKMDFLLEEHGPDALDLMARIKRSFDPLNILNPGKVVRV
jgi:D-lactate dehydrogenase (cytochrome)